MSFFYFTFFFDSFYFSTQGIVIAVNQGYPNTKGHMITPVLKVNDKVILPEFGGVEVKFDGKSYHLYREDYILGTF